MTVRPTEFDALDPPKAYQPRRRDAYVRAAIAKLAARGVTVAPRDLLVGLPEIVAVAEEEGAIRTPSSAYRAAEVLRSQPCLVHVASVPVVPKAAAVAWFRDGRKVWAVKAAAEAGAEGRVQQHGKPDAYWDDETR